MVNNILLYAGSIIVTIWGVAHLFPTKSVVDGFGPISKDNRRIITMEWIMEGLTLCFLGVLVFLITILAGPQNVVSKIVFFASSVMLVIMAVVSLVTGARASFIVYKLCPPIFLTAAVLIFLGGVL